MPALKTVDIRGNPVQNYRALQALPKGTQVAADGMPPLDYRRHLEFRGSAASESGER